MMTTRLDWNFFFWAEKNPDKLDLFNKKLNNFENGLPQQTKKPVQSHIIHHLHHHHSEKKKNFFLQINLTAIIGQRNRGRQTFSLSIAESSFQYPTVKIFENVQHKNSTDKHEWGRNPKTSRIIPPSSMLKIKYHH